MAAGSGSRYGTLKQFDKLGPMGEFLMEYSIYDAINSGFKKIVLITKKENKDFLYNYLRKKINKSIEIVVVAQEIENLPRNIVSDKRRIKPWGTAHAVWCAKNHINADFAIINADDYYGVNSFKNAAVFFNKTKNKDNYGLVVYKLKDTLSDYGSVSRGLCKVENKKLSSIHEYLKIEKNNDTIVDNDSSEVLNENDFVSMNFWLCRITIFDHLEEYIVKEIIKLDDIEKSEIYLPFAAQELVSKNIIEIDIVDSDSKWFGITYIEDKNKSTEKLLHYTNNGTYPSPLWIN